MAKDTQPPKSWDATAIRGLFDPTTGDLDRLIYDDEALHRLEIERIFGRAWNFMCHDSQIPNPGDYFINYIGEDQLICVRDDTGGVNILINTCRHRGNALCRAEQGNARSFVCSYHGWNYGLDGRLIGVPGLKTYFHGDLDREKLGLARAAQVESLHGFWFATLDPDAPPLAEFLGDVGRTALGMVVAHGDVEVVDGIQKNTIDCNWKIAVDNLFDWYHVMYSHASANSAGILDIAKSLQPNNQLVMLGEYGHAISGPGVPADTQAHIDGLSPDERRAFAANLPPSVPRLRPPSAAETMGPVGIRSFGHPNLFPNLWITLHGVQLCLRLPRGPRQTELWWFTVLPKAMPAEQRRRAVRQATHLFGPAGLLEQDDGENWSQSTRASRGRVSGRLGHTLQMGLGRDQVSTHPEGQRFVETQVNEHGQRWLYRAWVDWMCAESWTELKASRTPAPQGRV